MASAMTIRRITMDDPEYPKRLKEIHKPPAELYVNGAILPQDDMAVALVGSRRASMYGLEMAESLGYELALRGVTVVSGMARGIDTASHRGALKARGRTIAVMGGGHGHIYPPENKKLYAEIAASGAVVTEYPDDYKPMPFNFPQRNRIISGMSLGVVVVEAAKDSGALITSELASEQGREVFAVPGRISSATSSGTNSLIKDGATLVQTVDDILEGLSLSSIGKESREDRVGRLDRITRMTKAYVYNSLTDAERSVYKAISEEPAYIDEIMAKAAVEPAKASKALINLQLKKLVREVPGRRYLRTQN